MNWKNLSAAILSALLLLGTAGCTSRGSIVIASPPPAETAVPPQGEEPAPAPTPTATPEPTPDPTPEPTPEPTPRPARDALDYAARDLTGELRLALSTADDPEILLDADYVTALTFRGGATLRIESAEEMTGLYLIWDLPPEACTAAAEEWTATFGENGFLHEFEELPSGTTALEIELPAGSALSDVYAFTDGALPDFVQLWRPPAEEADLLLFPAHGDDELLFFGGTLPYYAGELGLKVQVAYLTTHWNEQPRPHEQINGLWAVGVRNYPVWSAHNDLIASTLSEARAIYGEKFTVYETQMIRRFKPLAVIGHDVNGEYGHGSHILASLSLQKAVGYASDPSYDPESAARYGIWDTPKTYLHLYAENRIVMDWDQPLERFGGQTAFEVAKLGYAQHLTQQQWRFRVEPIDSAYSCYRFGLYRSTVGEDVEKNDFLEHIPSRDELQG